MSLDIPILDFYEHRVKNLKPVGGGLKGICPFHDDRNPSLSINLETGSWFCHACNVGGGPRQFAERLGEPMPDDGHQVEPEVTYDYQDEEGRLLYQVVRLPGKRFFQRRPDGSEGWINNMDGVRRVLYRLNKLQRRKTVYLVEGEKDADKLCSLRIPATTAPGGAGKWRDEYGEQLKAAGVERVGILSDNDDEGRRHARQVAASCLKSGLQVKVVSLPGLPPKGDVSDWLGGGKNKEDLAREIKANPLLRLEDLRDARAEEIPGLNRGTLVEQVFDPVTGLHGFVYKDGERIATIPSYTVGDVDHEPLMRTMVEKGVILLPSGVEPYEGESGLASDVQAFIHRYVDVDPYFENLATWFVLFTWVYDAFSVSPYLRALGDWGTGKSRFIEAVGALCYKAIFASGATTVSPIFRILDVFKGTLTLDEADFKDSEAHADIIKILNQGYAKSRPVLRSEAVGKGFEPTAFEVFGPKVIATRRVFKDKALESRCLTKRFTGEPPRPDIPLNLPEVFWAEALVLRNKLLAWRFDKRDKVGIVNENPYRIPGIEPRLNQILMPLLSIIEDQDLKDEIKAMARTKQDEILEERSTSWAAWVLNAILELAKEGTTGPKVGDISKRAKEMAAAEGENLEKLTPKKVGVIVREQLNLRTEPDRRKNRVLAWDEKRIEVLKERYGLLEEPEGDGHDGLAGLHEGVGG